MRLCQSAEYALRAVVWLAAHPEAPLSTPDIARKTRVPRGYLSKVLQALARAGLVESLPGRRGGFRLARPAARLAVLDVVSAVDAVERIHGCPLGLRAHRGGLCPLHRRLDAVAARVARDYAGMSIADIAGEHAPRRALCDTKPVRRRSAARI